LWDGLLFWLEATKYVEVVGVRANGEDHEHDHQQVDFHDENNHRYVICYFAGALAANLYFAEEYDL
jgi:hypothetical protein